VPLCVPSNDQWLYGLCCRYATVGAVVDPVTNEKQEKAVFVVFFAGERARVKIFKASLSHGSRRGPVAMLECAAWFQHVLQASAATPQAIVAWWLRLAMFLQICEAYSANRYPFPEDQGRRREMNHEVNVRLQELHTTIDAGVLELQSAGCPCCVSSYPHV
jgi:V-type H+-transporting ATPase subunit a